MSSGLQIYGRPRSGTVSGTSKLTASESVSICAEAPPQNEWQAQGSVWDSATESGTGTGLWTGAEASACTLEGCVSGGGGVARTRGCGNDIDCSCDYVIVDADRLCHSHRSDWIVLETVPRETVAL